MFGYRIELLLNGLDPKTSVANGGKDDSPPPPDYSSVAAANEQAAKYAYDAANEDRAFRKEQWEWSKPRQEELYALATKVANQQFGIANQNEMRAAQQWSQQQGTFAPLERQMAMEAIGSQYLSDEDNAQLARLLAPQQIGATEGLYRQYGLEATKAYQGIPGIDKYDDLYNQMKGGYTKEEEVPAAGGQIQDMRVTKNGGKSDENLTGPKYGPPQPAIYGPEGQPASAEDNWIAQKMWEDQNKDWLASQQQPTKRTSVDEKGLDAAVNARIAEQKGAREAALKAAAEKMNIPLDQLKAAMAQDQEAEIARQLGLTQLTKKAEEAGAQQAMTQAGADINNVYAQQARNLMRYGGGDPAQMARFATQLNNQQALAKAGASNQAREQIRSQGRGLRAGAAGFGRNMPNTAAQAYGMATGAGNAAVGNQNAAFQSGLPYATFMSGGTGSALSAAGLAQQGALGMGNLMSRDYATQASMAANQADPFGALLGIGGSVGGAILGNPANKFFG